MKKSRKTFYYAGAVLAAFVLWTAALYFVDVQAVGPQDSQVGFATVNLWFHRLTGVHWTLYTLTDWLGLVPVAVGFAFAILGLVQWICRGFRRVDGDLLVLGGFYLVTLGAYLLFEEFAVNYRPVLIENRLEASYPSSTTLLVLCVMPTAAIELWHRVKNRPLRLSLALTNGGFTFFMVIGRLLSGVHWLSDIIGGILLSAALVLFYQSICEAWLRRATPQF